MIAGVLGCEGSGTWADNTDTMNSGTMLGKRRTRDTGSPSLQNQGEPAGKAI